jgi:outer membrane protein OmpA-like peptidoglycan-associated protein
MKQKFMGLATIFLLVIFLGGCAKKAPIVSCSVSPEKVTQGDKAEAKSEVVAKKGEKLTYTWTASGGKIAGSQDKATFESAGVNPGKYTITVNVADKHKHNVACNADVTVEKKYLPPTVTCSASPESIQAGESSKVTAKATSPDGSPLTYSWTVNGQAQAADFPEFVFGSVGRNPGNYTIAATVNTGKFKASCSSNVAVREIPIPPPTISCLSPTVDVESDTAVPLKVQVTAERATPSVSWSTTGGAIIGSGESVSLNTAGLKAGSYIVTATVDNGRGGRASCSTTVNVSQKIGLPGFPEGRTRVNNEAKALLDDVAVQMKNAPQLHASVAGFTDGSKREARIKELGLKRAKAIMEYLVSKGIDASRIATTDGGVSTVGDSKTKAGREENRHAVLQLSVH